MICGNCGLEVMQLPCGCGWTLGLKSTGPRPTYAELADGIPEPFPLTLVRRYRQQHRCTHKEAILAVLPKWIQANPDDEHTESAVELVSRALVNFRPRTIDDPASVYGMHTADRAYQLCDAYQQGGLAGVRQFITDHPLPKAIILVMLVVA